MSLQRRTLLPVAGCGALLVAYVIWGWLPADPPAAIRYALAAVVGIGVIALLGVTKLVIDAAVRRPLAALVGTAADAPRVRAGGIALRGSGAGQDMLLSAGPGRAVPAGEGLGELPRSADFREQWRGHRPSDRREMPEDMLVDAILRVFAARAGAELERKHALEALHRIAVPATPSRPGTVTLG